MKLSCIKVIAHHNSNNKDNMSNHSNAWFPSSAAHAMQTNGTTE